MNAKLAGVVFNRAQAKDFARSISGISLRSIARQHQTGSAPNQGTNGNGNGGGNSGNGNGNGGTTGGTDTGNGGDSGGGDGGQ